VAFGSSRLADLVLRYQSVGLPEALAGQRQLQVGARQTAVVTEGANKGMTASALRLSAAQERVQQLQRQGIVGGRRLALAQAAVLEAQNATTGATNRTSESLVREERALDRVTRGAIAGSGVFKTLGRSVAFSSGAFLGGLGLVFAVRSSIKAAEDHQAALVQLSAALKAAGIDESKYGTTIQDTLRKQRLLTGFTEDQTTRAFTLLARTTGSVEGGFRALGVAQNVALGANKGLEETSLKVARAYNGQTRGLVALGVHLDKGVKGWQALDIVQGKFAGSAAAAAQTAVVAQRRFGQAIHETEVTIGTALLPTLTKYLGKGADWLGQSKNQERVQKDVNSVVHTAGTVIHDLSRFISGANTVLQPFVKLVGGAGHALELAFGLAIGLKLKAFLATTRLLGTTAVTAAAEADAAINSIGNTALAQVPKLEAMGAAESTLAGRIGAYGVGGAVGGAGAGAALARGAGKLLPAGVAGAVGFLTLGQQGEQGDKPKLVYNPSTDTYRLVYSGLFKGLSRNVSSEEARQYDPKAWYQGRVIWASKHNREVKDATDSYTALFQGKTGKTTTAAAAALPRDQQIALDLSRAQNRNDTAGQLRALNEQVAFDAKYIAIQERLLKTDVAHRAEHAKILQRLYGDQETAQAQIDSINSKAASDARSKRSAAAAKERERARAYRAGITTTISRLETAVANARTPAGVRRSEDALIDFYQQEARDKELTAKERASFALRAAREAKRERDSVKKAAVNAREEAIKTAVLVAEIALEKAKKGTAAYATALAAEKKALLAEENFYAKLARATKDSRKKQQDLQKELAAARQLKALDKKAGVSGSGKSDIAAFLSEFRSIISKFSPNYFPGQPDSQSATHLYEIKHETRKQTEHLKVLTTQGRFPANSYARATAADGFGL
jgi:hypothetical protein